MALPYNPATVEYSGARPESNIAPKLQSFVISNYALDRYIVVDKEIKGGVHRVSYKSQLLVSNSYDGIQTSKRVKGMLCYVSFEDDGSDCDKYFSLKTLPGNLLSHWVEIGAGSPITLTNPQVTATIITRDALTPASGDFVTVIDARTPQEIIDDDPVYAKSYIWNGTAWVQVTMYGSDPNSHVKNTDTQLVRASNGAAVTADSIANHIASTSLHKNVNDANDDGAANEEWSSLKIRTELNNKVDAVTDGDGTLFLSDDGTYKIVSASGTGNGLLTGDVLNGGSSVLYPNGQ